MKTPIDQEENALDYICLQLAALDETDHTLEFHL